MIKKFVLLIIAFSPFFFDEAVYSVRLTLDEGSFEKNTKIKIKESRPCEDLRREGLKVILSTSPKEPLLSEDGEDNDESDSTLLFDSDHEDSEGEYESISSHNNAAEENEDEYESAYAESFNSEDGYECFNEENDGRERVNDTRLLPYAFQGYVGVKREGLKPSRGSGILVGPRHVLTAGHVVYTHEKGWADEIEFIPAYDKNKEREIKPFGKAKAVRIHTFEKWRDEGNKSYDLALIRQCRHLI